MSWSGHVMASGITGSGKTYWALARLREHAGPALFINPQDEAAPGLVRADQWAAWPQVWSAAQRGCNYVTSANDDRARAELAYIVDRLFARAHAREVLLCVDEAHVFAPEGAGKPSPLHRVARRGRKFGIRLLLVSQSPADIAKAVVRMCERHVIFRSQFSGPYFARYGIPGDQVRELIDRGGPHAYVVWDGAALTGPFREGA